MKDGRLVSVGTRRSGAVLFFWFGVVGAAGFFVDTSAYYLAQAAGCQPWLGRGIAFGAGVTFTWLANRHFTFMVPHRVTIAEWLKYVAANSGGGIVSYALSVFMLYRIQIAVTHPVVAIAAGGCAGLVVNFVLTHFMVFQGARSPSGDSVRDPLR